MYKTRVNFCHTRAWLSGFNASKRGLFVFLADNKNFDWTIIGIVVGVGLACIVLIAVVIALLVYYCKRKKNR